MLCERFLPDDDVRLVRSITVDASSQQTFEAIRPARIGDDQVLAAASWLQELPERALSFFQRQEPEPEMSSETTIGDLLEADYVIPLAEEPGREVLVGAVGRFWNPMEVLESVDREAFHTYDEPGSAKAVVSLSLHERHEDTCLLVLEARAKGTDASGRLRLRRWAQFVKPVAGLLARRALDVIRARAEGGPVAALPETTPTEIEAGSGVLPTLDDATVDGRRVLLRIDANSPIEDGRITGRERLQAAADSIRTLLERQAGVVVLAHQGRPGREDFTDLSQHAEILAELAGTEVRHVEAIESPEAHQAVDGIDPGEVLLLGNVRGAEGETQAADGARHARREWVRRLAENADLYVNDAFPVCHRSHASVVGFPHLMPAAAGPGLVRELEALERVGEQPAPRVLVLGGAKPVQSLDALAHQLARDRVDEVLVGGLLASAFLEAEGHDTGQGTRALLEDHGHQRHLQQTRSLLETYTDRIRLPTDVAIASDGERLEVPVDELPAEGRILDVGAHTADSFADRVNDAGTALVHGPMGVYEEPPFDRGTHRVFSAASKAPGYTVIGGGHTVHAMTQLGIDAGGFDHVSLAGGALLATLAGEPLPGVEALRASAARA